MKISQYQIVLVNLDPTIGHEIKKTRPCLVISPDEMNRNLQTVIVAPITSADKSYPTRVFIEQETLSGQVALDQIRTIDRKRIIKTLDSLTAKKVKEIKQILKEMLID